MSFVKPSNFIDVFKIGDNINYNLKILKSLYKSYDESPEGGILIKPIVIINTSIVEAILFDLIENKIRRPYYLERIFPEVREALVDKKLDKFEHYITQAKKYDFFSMGDTNFYEAMHSLRKKRNRIHIQNQKHEEPHNEEDIFNERLKILSEKVLEKTINTMISKYQRPVQYHRYVDDFELPWDKHFD